MSLTKALLRTIISLSISFCTILTRSLRFFYSMNNIAAVLQKILFLILFIFVSHLGIKFCNLQKTEIAETKKKIMGQIFDKLFC